MSRGFEKRDKNCLLVLTDSRLKNLKTKLESDDRISSLCCDIYVERINGAKLSYLIDRAIEYLDGSYYGRRYNVKYVVLLAGICDFTVLKSTQNKRYVEYSRREVVLHELQDKIRSVYQKYSGKINIGTFAPACLEQSLTTQGLDSSLIANLESSQSQLITDIEETNKIIVEHNKISGVETIDLADKAYSHSKKKKEGKRRSKFVGKKFVDGVHPSDNLKEKWHSLSIEVILREAKRLPPRELSGDSVKRKTGATSSDSSEDEDNKCFKRKRQANGKISVGTSRP